jgi:hypothetical protein
MPHHISHFSLKQFQLNLIFLLLLRCSVPSDVPKFLNFFHTIQVLWEICVRFCGMSVCWFVCLLVCCLVCLSVCLFVCLFDLFFRLCLFLVHACCFFCFVFLNLVDVYIHQLNLKYNNQPSFKSNFYIFPHVCLYLCFCLLRSFSIHIS